MCRCSSKVLAPTGCSTSMHAGFCGIWSQAEIRPAEHLRSFLWTQQGFGLQLGPTDAQSRMGVMISKKSEGDQAKVFLCIALCPALHAAFTKCWMDSDRRLQQRRQTEIIECTWQSAWTQLYVLYTHITAQCMYCYFLLSVQLLILLLLWSLLPLYLLAYHYHHCYYFVLFDQSLGIHMEALNKYADTSNMQYVSYSEAQRTQNVSALLQETVVSCAGASCNHEPKVGHNDLTAPARQ